jgi:hypothetical protein
MRPFPREGGGFAAGTAQQSHHSPMSVNRHWIGTPDQHPKGGSDAHLMVPRLCRSDDTSLKQVDFPPGRTVMPHSSVSAKFQRGRTPTTSSRKYLERLDKALGNRERANRFLDKIEAQFDTATLPMLTVIYSKFRRIRARSKSRTRFAQAFGIRPSDRAILGLLLRPLLSPWLYRNHLFLDTLLLAAEQKLSTRSFPDMMRRHGGLIGCSQYYRKKFQGYSRSKGGSVA